MSTLNDCNRAVFGPNQDDLTVENCSGSTHPRTEQSTVCGRLVLGVVISVFCCLDLGHPSDEQKADDKQKW